MGQSGYAAVRIDSRRQRLLCVRQGVGHRARSPHRQPARAALANEVPAGLPNALVGCVADLAGISAEPETRYRFLVGISSSSAVVNAAALPASRFFALVDLVHDCRVGAESICATLQHQLAQ